VAVGRRVEVDVGRRVGVDVARIVGVALPEGDDVIPDDLDGSGVAE
jgi:hypothetical protein